MQKAKKTFKRTIFASYHMKKVLLFTCWILSVFCYGQMPFKVSDYNSIILSQNTTLKITDLEGMKLSSQSFDKSNGVSHIYIDQYYKSLPVYNAVMQLHLDDQGKLLSLNHSFVKNITSYSGSVIPKLKAADAALIALKAFTSDINTNTKNPSFHVISETPFESVFMTIADYTSNEVKVNLKWLPLNNQLLLVWNINWLSVDGQNWWNIRMDAHSGEILDKNNWVVHCQEQDVEDCSHTLSSPIPSSVNPFLPLANAQGLGVGKTNAKYNVFPRPVESPSHGNRSVLTDPSDSLSSPFSWHDDNGVVGNEYTIARGNNVHAYEDKNNDNLPGYSPNGGTNLNFDYSFDKTKRHTDYQDAAITNLFYWNNLMHDVWYHYGFDDASGNFQANNYSRGGIGSDEVMAEAQDGSGTNNANFATPPDGQNPRMQMFVWNVSSTSLLLRVTQPSSIARQYVSVLAGFGPALTKNPISGNLVLANDGSANPTLACNSLLNQTSMNGQIALIDRGNCTFIEKVTFAQNAGAKAVVVINNVPGNPITMGGTGGTGITIPSIMITQADGSILKNTLNGGQTVKVSLYDSIGAAGKQYDSDFDATIISHEFGHGISNRLTGGASNTNCLTNEEQMGEGWSDFFGLVMTHKLGDKGPDRRGIGTYVIDEPNNGGGIRNYPYSTSFSINPVTYKDIKTFSIPHGVGSVWCSMLWDMYWDMIDKYGYDTDIYCGKGGNNIAMKLVVDGLKLQPCNPGFTDGRDAILLADRINNKGANQELIWRAFARRGLGSSASQGAKTSRSDGAEAFDIPKFDLPVITKVTKAETKVGDTLSYKIIIKNLNSKTLKQIAFRDTIKSGLQFIKAQGCFNGALNNNIYTANIDSLRPGDSLVCYIQAKVTSTAFTSIIETTDFEGGAGKWKDSTLAGTGSWISRTNKKYNGTRSYFIANAGTVNDKVLIKKFDLKLAAPYLIFYHNYNTEADWDGGVIEIFDKGWKDLGAQIIENKYNSVIEVNPESAISGRSAFSGNSINFIRTVVDLSPYKGDSARIRFRFVSDGAQGGEGWYIDDITLVDNLTMVTNRATVSSLSGVSNSASVSTLVLKGTLSGIYLPKTPGFKVSPNPFNTEIRIETSHRNYSVVLMDMTGKTIFKENHINTNFEVETSSLASGTYVLRIETTTGIEVIKLVK